MCEAMQCAILLHFRLSVRLSHSAIVSKHVNVKTSRNFFSTDHYEIYKNLDIVRQEDHLTLALANLQLAHMQPIT